MNFNTARIPYRQTGAFSGLVLDFIDQAESIRPFLAGAASLQGLEKAIERRDGFNTNRAVLVEALTAQYAGVETSELVRRNIQLLASANTYTITTAHQNNIFTGPLYFIYKILHAIKLAQVCSASFPGKTFVPVYYMGSEDADLDELNHITITGEKLQWETNQRGAVGRMLVDKSLLSLIDRMEGMLGVWPHGAEITGLLRAHYKAGTSLQQATFQFVDALFSRYGLVVLIPDNALLKKQLTPLFREELLKGSSASVVQETNEQLAAAGYKVQASGRAINLFYLKDDIRNRIEKSGEGYKVVDTALKFTTDGLLAELDEHPERFSPNVILRGLYQETILPNITFIGGGGETAYWLQLKKLFEYYRVPFPILVLRNSFLLVEKKWQEYIRALDFTTEDLFQPESRLMSRIMERGNPGKTNISDSIEAMNGVYEKLKLQAAEADSTLQQHVAALNKQAVSRLQELEKKMYRAEKRKYATEQQRIQKLKQVLFPGNGLQERTENISYFYAKWGSGLLDQLLEASLGLEQEFVLLKEV